MLHTLESTLLKIRLVILYMAIYILHCLKQEIFKHNLKSIALKFSHLVNS